MVAWGGGEGEERMTRRKEGDEHETILIVHFV